MTESTDSAASTVPPGAVRLIFEYDGDNIRLVLQQPVDVAVTGFDTALVSPPGHYVEVRSSEGRALSRVRVHGGIPESAEVFGEPGTPITRVDLARPKGAFTVVVPAPAAAARIALLRVEPPTVEPPAVAPSGGPSPAPSGTRRERVVELLDATLER